MITWCDECGIVKDGKHAPSCYWTIKKTHNLPPWGSDAYKKETKRISDFSNTHIVVVENGKLVIKPKEKP